MQGKSFFTDLTSTQTANNSLPLQPQAIFAMWVGDLTRSCDAESGQNPLSDRHFGEDVHAADLRCHPPVLALFLHSDNRRLAADPALLAGGELGGEDKNQFDVRSLLHLGVGVQEHAVGADIAGFGRAVFTLRSAYARRHPRRNSGTGSALAIWLCGRH